jgi:AraC-like DNA-binding protein
MQSDATQPGFLRVSTRALPALDRMPFWREAFARQMCRLEFEPLFDAPLDVEGALLALPGLRVNWCLSAAPARWSRTRELVKDGDDAFVLIMPLAGAVMRSQRGHDLLAESGDGVGILNAEPASMQFRELDHMAVIVPRSALTPLVTGLERASTRLVPRTNEAFRLLRAYLMGLRDNADIRATSLCKLAVTHVYDLVALALGATRDGAAIAAVRGMRAARLKAVKDDLAANPGLRLAALAARQRVTPRYVQLLFEEVGTTFTAYARDERLNHAHRMLCDARYSRWTISDIAYRAGFGDLSHFNHVFRRRYGATPSEVREVAFDDASSSRRA